MKSTTRPPHRHHTQLSEQRKHYINKQTKKNKSNGKDEKKRNDNVCVLDMPTFYRC